MKKLIILSFTLVFLVTGKVSAQETSYFHHENLDKVFTKSQSSAFYRNDSVSLQDYLSNELHEIISKTNGVIDMGVVIDTTGKPYCRLIKNHSNLNTENINLASLIESLPTWVPGEQNGHKVNCAVKIILRFTQSKLVTSYEMGSID